MNRIERYVEIEPMNVSPGNWLRFIVRHEGVIAVVAQFHAGWNRLNSQSTSNPGLTSITIHRPCGGGEPDHKSCGFLHDSGSMDCQNNEYWLSSRSDFRGMHEELQKLLLTKGSIDVLDFLEKQIYYKEIEA